MGLARWRKWLGVATVSGMLLGMMATAQAEQPGTYEFWETWARTDLAVAESVDKRTWMWGPEAISDTKWEEYVEAPDGYAARAVLRQVAHGDHRSERDPTDSLWYVTNGLLVDRARSPASCRLATTAVRYTYARPTINVAGDSDDPTAPTYATFGSLLDVAARLARMSSDHERCWTADGVPWNDDSYAALWRDDRRRVRAGHRPQVASVFWDFMNVDGTVWRDGGYIARPLFETRSTRPATRSPRRTGPASRSAGPTRDVLMQCFERRCLTYTPGNPAGWQVEAGNVGQHYYVWRYGDLPAAYR